MDKQKHDFLKELLFVMSENFSDTVSSIAVRMYISILSEYSIDEIKQAAVKIITTRKYNKMPPIGEFLEYIHGSTDDNAEVEAAKVLWAVQRVGPYRSVAFDNPVTQAVISSYGGWPAFVDEVDKESKKKWIRFDVAKIYKAFCGKGVKRYGYLPGLFEMQGEDRKKEIVFVGDPDVAKKIMQSDGIDNSAVQYTQGIKLTSGVLGY